MRQAWGWDPLLQCLYLDAPLLQQQNTKKLYGTKNNCACALGANSLEQILDAKGTKRPKTSASTSEEPRTKTGLWGAKQEDYAFPCTDHLSHPSSPTPGHIPTLTLCEEQDCSTLGSERAISIDEEGQKPWLVTHRDFYVY